MILHGLVIGYLSSATGSSLSKYDLPGCSKSYFILISYLLQLFIYLSSDLNHVLFVASLWHTISPSPSFISPHLQLTSPYPETPYNAYWQREKICTYHFLGSFYFPPSFSQCRTLVQLAQILFDMESSVYMKCRVLCLLLRRNCIEDMTSCSNCTILLLHVLP